MKRLALVLLSLASAGLADSPKPAIVLVHGAFADGSSWSRVIPILERDGYTVTAVQIPLTSLPDDVATTKRVIDAQKVPVVVVGHSYHGVVITAGGGQLERQGPRLCGRIRARCRRAGQRARCSIRAGSAQHGYRPRCGRFSLPRRRGGHETPDLAGDESRWLMMTRLDDLRRPCRGPRFLSAHHAELRPPHRSSFVRAGPIRF